jgi:hypothetical protein
MRSGHAHHCEALPLGHRLKRPTKGGANRSRTNNAPPPCENLHDRRFFTRTFLMLCALQITMALLPR